MENESLRRKIAQELLSGDLSPEGFAPCPGQCLHTTRSGTRDFQVRKERQIDLFTGKPEPGLTWRQQYSQLLKSNKWRELKRKKAALVGNKCQKCSQTTGFDLHHLHYEKPLGTETLKDVELVCYHCHPSADRARERQRAEALAEAADDAKKRGRWARRQFGDGWRDIPAHVIEEIYTDEHGDEEEEEEWM
jgi:hypothetical protein